MKNDIDIIDAYLRGTLSEEEVKDLEDRLKTDSAFADLYVESKSIQEGIRYHSLKEKVTFLEALENEIISSEKKETKAKVISLNWMKYAIAASVIFLVGYFGVVKSSLFTQDNDQYAYIFSDEHFDTFIYHRSDRSGEASEYTIDQVSAYNLYSLQEFEKALPLLQRLWEEEGDLRAYYYVGICHIGLNNLDKAKSILRDPKLQSFKNPFKNSTGPG